MAQQVIDGILYSPVPAHALRRGDLIRAGYADTPTARLSSHALHTTNMWGPACLFDTDCGGLEFGINVPVMRAVGATVGGLL